MNLYIQYVRYITHIWYYNMIHDNIKIKLFLLFIILKLSK